MAIWSLPTLPRARAHVRYMHVRTCMICVYLSMDMCIYTPFVRLVSLVSPFKSPPAPLPPCPRPPTPDPPQLLLRIYYDFTTSYYATAELAIISRSSSTFASGGGCSEIIHMDLAMLQCSSHASMFRPRLSWCSVFVQCFGA